MSLDLSADISSVVSGTGGLTTQVPVVVAAALLVLAGILAFKFGVRLVRSYVR